MANTVTVGRRRFAGDRSSLAWGGTLQVTTYGGTAIATSLDNGAFDGVLVALSAYNIDGELVLRAEHQAEAPTIREACKAYGYDNITWLDDRLPAE